MTRTTFLDCEFDPRNSALPGLLSLGVTDDDGTDYYAVNADADFGAVLDHAFIVEHVLPHMPVTVHRDSAGTPVAIAATRTTSTSGRPSQYDIRS